VSNALAAQHLSTTEFHSAVYNLSPSVAVFDCDGTLWSGDAGSGFMTYSVETGLLSPSDWSAKWIRRTNPAAEQELAAVRWLWLPNADAQHVPANTTAEFRYTLHLDAAPTRASLHIVSPGAYVATVNSTVTGQHKAWGAFDWEEIGPLLKSGDNEILVKVIAQAKVSAPEVSTAFAASLRITASDGTQRRIPSDATWQARTDSNAEWQPAQVVGPITTPLSIGTDRHSEVPGPNRIATEAALLRKDLRGDAQCEKQNVHHDLLDIFHNLLFPPNSNA